MGHKSDVLFEQSKKRIPGGVNSPVRAFRAVNRNPVFIQKAKGSHIVDVDGQEYIDYVCSWGPGILGHADPEVIDAVKQACENGLSFGAPTEQEYEMAELIARLVPSMEMSRMVSSGTEAVMSAIRAARGYTNRDYIIKFRGCYHGHSDGLLVKAGSGVMTQTIADSKGVPKGYAQYTLLADYNRIDTVKQLFSEYPDQIAAVVVEPVAANMGVVPPKNDFLKELRAITKQNHALLIFDEVITGFRLGLGGAQEYYGVTPDLTTLGKIVGGGMPVGAYGGRKEIMECVAPVGEVYQAGTLSGNPVAMTAGLVTLRKLEANKEIYRKLDTYAEQLMNCYQNAFKDRVCVNRVGSLLSVFFTSEPVEDEKTAKTSDVKAYSKYFNFMFDAGIYLAPSQFEAMFVSAAHNEEDLERTCRQIEACAEYMD